MVDSGNKHLIIRADASTEVGTGHVMRCLALGQAWKDAGGNVVFVTACQSEGLLQRLAEEGFEVHVLSQSYPDQSDWDHTKQLLVEHPDAWMVLDGYHFDEVYQRHVKETGNRLLVIDDMAHLKHYYADIVLNQNLHAQQLHYNCEPSSQLLLGTKYVLLRREFLGWKDWKRDIPEVARRILVTLGGSDPQNHTLKVMQALQRLDAPCAEATVIIGASNPHASVLEEAARQSCVSIRLTQAVRKMPDLMAWADLAISGAGTTIWELLFLRTPTLALILADNQRYVAEQIDARGLARTLDASEDMSIATLAQTVCSLLKDFDSRKKMSTKGRRVVDGNGASRVMTIMEAANHHKTSLRLATSEDCRLFWQWANDPVARDASFSSESIPWGEHVKWFETKLHDPCWHCYVYVDWRGLPLGQVRFDTDGNKAEIGVTIDPLFRCRGHGAEAIRLASGRLFGETEVTRIYAHIKQGNTASIHAFTRAGYKKAGVKMMKGQQAIQMILEKNDAVSKDESY